MRSTRARRFVPALITAGAIALTACGGGDGDDAASPSETETSVTGEPSGDDAGAPRASDDPVDGGEAGGRTPVTELRPTHVDLIGETVVAEAEIESNLLPAVVLDDLTTGRRVNFRNLVPQDTPILLWMWAPF